MCWSEWHSSMVDDFLGSVIVGIITLALLSAGHIPSADVPTWVIVSCALSMGLGTALGGWKIIKTLGMRIAKLDPVHGFAWECELPS